MRSHGLETGASLLAEKGALEKLVCVDGLTGIPNRRGFDQTLHRECAISRRTAQPLSLLMIDVDHFNQINDTLGHLVGDEYLVRIAAVLDLTLPRATDFLARYGGEEFMVILPMTDTSGAATTAAKLLRATTEANLNHPTEPSGIVTVSIGYSSYEGTPLDSLENLVHAADRALYLAKSNGRNRAEFLPIQNSVE